MKGLRDKNKNTVKNQEVAGDEVSGQDVESNETTEQKQNEKKSLFEKWSDKFRDFLDNAE
jgi:cell division protein FtsA